MPYTVPVRKSSGASGGYVVPVRSVSGERGGYLVPRGGAAGGGSRKRKKSDGGLLGALEHHAPGVVGRAIGGVVHFQEHLARDVGEALVGLPMGLVQTVEHPIRTAKQIGRSYEQTYGPLTHGDVSKFLHNLYEHPLGPILDVATILTGGAGAAAKVGGGLAKAGVISDASRIARLGERGTIALRNEPALVRAGRLEGFAGHEAAQANAQTLLRETSANPAIRLRQQAFHRVLNLVPAHMPMVGEIARYSRELDRLVRRGPRALQLQVRSYRNAYSALNKRELVAFHFRATAVDPREYAAMLEREHPTPPAQVAQALALFRDPRFLKVYDDATGNTRLQRALEKGRELAQFLRDHHETVARAGGEDEAALAALMKQMDERPYLHQRLLSGARFAPDVPAIERQIETARRYGDEQRAAELELFLRHHATAPEPGASAAERLSAGMFVRPADRGNLGRVVSIDGQHASVHFVNRESGQRATRSFHHSELEPLTREAAASEIRVPHSLQGGKSISELRAEATARGHAEPFYMPDIAATRQMTLHRAGGGQGIPAPEGALNQNRGILFLTARLAMHPEALDQAFMAHARFVLHDAIHEALMSNAIRVPRGAGAPKGYVFIRQLPSERILHTERVQGDVIDRLTKLTSDEGAQKAMQELVTPNEEEAVGAGTPYRLVVSEQFARGLTGEYVKSNRFIRAFWEKPTQVWRAIVLGGRPAFFINNVLGNHFLLAMHHASPSFARAYLSFLREVKGDRFVQGFVKRHREQREFRSIMDDLVPEQVMGTFGRTQFPHNVPGLGQKLAQGVGPATARFSEDIPRELSVRTTVARSLREMGEKVPRTPAEFNAAARRILSDPKLAARAIKDANDALGDYLGLSELERRTVRQAIPFYAWLRIITTIALRTAADTPGRALLLAQLGSLGARETQQALGPLPTFLHGAVPAGGLPAFLTGPSEPGRTPVISTGGLNPLATVPQVITATGALVSGKPGEIGRAIGPQLNPLLQGLIESLAGRSLTSGGQAPARGSGGGLAGNIGRNVVEGLPPLQLLQAAAGTGYRGAPGKPTLYRKDFRTALLAYLGAPVKQLSSQKAREMAAKGL